MNRSKMLRSFALAFGLALALSPLAFGQDSNPTNNSPADASRARSVSSGQQMKIKGVVVHRDPDTFTVRDINGVDTTNDRISALDDYVPQDSMAVNFRTGSAVLNADAKTKLDQIATKALNAKAYVVEVTGHADARGNTNFNRQLSQRRADACIRYLVEQHKIPLRRIVTQRNLMLLDQITNACIGPALAELAIEVSVARGISVTGYFHNISFGVQSFGGNLIQFRLGVGVKHRAARPKVDRHRILRHVIVKRRDAIVGGVHAINIADRKCIGIAVDDHALDFHLLAA